MGADQSQRTTNDMEHYDWSIQKLTRIVQTSGLQISVLSVIHCLSLLYMWHVHTICPLGVKGQAPKHKMNSWCACVEFLFPPCPVPCQRLVETVYAGFDGESAIASEFSGSSANRHTWDTDYCIVDIGNIAAVLLCPLSKHTLAAFTAGIPLPCVVEACSAPANANSVNWSKQLHTANSYTRGFLMATFCTDTISTDTVAVVPSLASWIAADTVVI